MHVYILWYMATSTYISLLLYLVAWDNEFDLIVLLHDESGYTGRAIVAKNFLVDLFQR